MGLKYFAEMTSDELSGILTDRRENYTLHGILHLLDLNNVCVNLAKTTFKQRRYDPFGEKIMNSLKKINR